MSRIRANQITNQSADGAPTVQNGLVISGVTTSTTFSGSGASLTSLPAANLTGTLPAISGANLTSLPSQLTLSNNADNRVITGGSGVNLNGEANLTYNGSSSLLGNLATSSTNNLELMRLENSHSDGKLTVIGFKTTGLGYPQTRIYGGNDNSGAASQQGDSGAGKFKVTITNPSGTHQEVIYAENDANTASKFVRLSTNGSERLRIGAHGSVGINTTAPENNSNDVSLHIHGTANDDCRIAFSTPTKSNPGSRIGYYGLNRFGIDTYDGLEVRDVTASYATRLKIDQNGYLTLPNTPAASAYVSSSSPGAANNKIQNATLGLNNTHYNNGGHFNTSNYRFTCPVTGYYKVSFSTNLHTSNHSDGQNFQINLQVNGSTRHIHYDTKQSSHTWLFMGWAETVLCSANDYISLSVAGNAVLGVDSSVAWNRTTFELIG